MCPIDIYANINAMNISLLDIKFKTNNDDGIESLQTGKFSSV